jgi:hypothetical protein
MCAAVEMMCECNMSAELSHIKKEYGRVLVLTPIILATWEAEIRRITVQSQPRQIVRETLS